MMNSLKSISASLMGLLLFGLAGCSVVGPKPPELSPIVPILDEDTQKSTHQNGTIFRVNDGFSFFEERRPNKVGSTILVIINESMSASKTASTKAARQSSANSSVTAVPGINVPTLKDFSLGGASKNDFSGSGQSAANNVFTGTITTTIAKIYPNGNYLLKGNKEIGLNQEVETIKFSGIVSPTNIKSDGSVSSQSISDVRIETRSSGAINESQVAGWLSRIFMSYSPI